MIIKDLFLKLIPGAYNKSRFGVIYIVTFRGTRMRIEKKKKKKKENQSKPSQDKYHFSPLTPRNTKLKN